MKRYFSLLLLSLACLTAYGLATVAIDAQSLLDRSDHSSLNQLVRDLDTRDVEIYYYDQSTIIAGLEEELKDSFIYEDYTQLASLQPGQSYYLFTKLPSFDLPQGLDLQVEMEQQVLAISSLDAVALRQLCPHPFVELNLEPIKFAGQSSPSYSYLQSDRTTISELVNAVSQDSITAFIQHLEDYGTRYALADNRLEIAQWIQSKFISYGMTDVELFPFQWNNTTQYNVVATLPGSHNPDEYIIVGGHHDSISGTTPYETAPGADDNASGTVAALEMARVMMQEGYQPKCSIRFVTFAAEEFGLWGSRAYANFAEANDLNVRLMMNHDMLAYSTEDPSIWRVRLMPYDGALAESDLTAQITSQYTSLNPVYGSMNSSSSDSFPFWQKGYPVVYFFEYAFTPNYHTPLDLVENLNPVYCTEVIKASVATATAFSQLPTAPANAQLDDPGTGTELLLSWDAYAGVDIAGYNLYIAPSGEPMPEPILTNQTQYTFGGLTEGVSYEIELATLDNQGNESTRLSFSGTPLSIPRMPEGFAEQPLPNGISLSWQPNSELDFAGYVLFRSTDPESIGNPVSTAYITQTSYLDEAVTGGTHYYYYTLVAMDTDHNVSPYTETLSSRPISLDQGILIVDETRNLGGGTMFQITDEQADSFFSSLLPGASITEIDLEDHAYPIRLADICVYSSILWHGNDISDMDYPYNIRTALQSYLDAGGQILFSVMQPSLAFELNANYPQNFMADSFISQYMGISGVDYTNTARFRYAEPTSEMLPLLSIDPAKVPASWHDHIFRVEGLSATADATVLYNYASDYEDDSAQGLLNGAVVGIFKDVNPGKTVTLSFPLYYIEEQAARDFVRSVFTNQFGESVSNQDQYSSPAASLSLSSVYPNPFASIVSFELESKEPGKHLDVDVYNIRGQLVKTIFSGNPANQRLQMNWDGRDSGGKPCASGIYYIRARQDGSSISRKLVLIR